LQVTNIHENHAQHNVAWKLLPAILIPQNGTSLHTIAAPGGIKVLANVDMRTGSGLPRRARRVAIAAHDVCQVFVHADMRDRAAGSIEAHRQAAYQPVGETDGMQR
jgi:hypothetical protein